jgi:iron complex outermembrane receptor protein
MACLRPFTLSGASFLALVAMPIVATAPARAQTAEPVAPDNGDIIVTAQRRSQSVETVPISISAISGDTLVDRGVRSVADIANTVPNVDINETQGEPAFTIRGVTSGSGATEPGTAIYIDNVYIFNPSLATHNFLDLDRVEVLRGPQGTLYGKNSVGGNISLYSKTPTDRLEGYLEGNAGNYDTYGVRGALNVPLADGIAARVAGSYDTTDGYFTNVSTGKEYGSSRIAQARGTLKFDRGPFTLIVRGNYSRRTGQGDPLPSETPPSDTSGIIDPTGIVFGRGSFEVASRTPEYRSERGAGVSADATLNVGSFMTIHSITAYQYFRSNFLTDTDSFDVALQSVLFGERSRAFSQELLLSSQDSSARLRWLVGGYYNRADVYDSVLLKKGTEGDPRVIPYGETVTSSQNTIDHTYGLFANLEFDLTSRLTAIGGLRWSKDKKDNTESDNIVVDIIGIDTGTLLFQGADSWSAYTPSFKLTYKLGARALLYANVSRGFKTGGFNFNVSPAPLATYNPEFVWNYEAGLKSRFLEGKLQTDLSVFQMDYTNQQISYVNPDLSTITLNAGSSRIRGIEAEVVARPLARVRFDFNGAYLDARYTKFTRLASDGVTNIDFAGQRMPSAPKYSASVGLEYALPLGKNNLVVRGEYQYRSSTLQTPQTGDDPVIGLPAHSVVNANATLNLGNGITIAAFVRNLTNERYLIASSRNSLGETVITPGAPRTVGGRIRYSF